MEVSLPTSFKKVGRSVNLDAIATILVYCMAVDGPVRHSADPVSPDATLSPGFVGGSRALDALHQFITSKELLFHPSSPSQVTRPVCDEPRMAE